MVYEGGAPGISVRRIGDFKVDGPFLVGKSQSKLDGTRKTALMVHYAERGPQTYAWFSELRVVKQVEYFAAELQFGLFRYVEGLVS